jgi:putative transposase
MSRYRRVTGPTFFFTVVAYRRRAIFCDDAIRDALNAAIQYVRARHPFCIDAWVLLPDHMHAIWTLPNGDHDFSSRWAMIKRFVSTQCGANYHRPETQTNSARRRRESTIWQRRFWEHRIRDERDMEMHMDYVHFNPVRHGYVRSVAEWKYSTFHRHVKAGLYPADWGRSPGLADVEFE